MIHSTYLLVLCTLIFGITSCSFYSSAALPPITTHKIVLLFLNLLPGDTQFCTTVVVFSSEYEGAKLSLKRSLNPRFRWSEVLDRFHRILIGSFCLKALRHISIRKIGLKREREECGNHNEGGGLSWLCQRVKLLLLRMIGIHPSLDVFKFPSQLVQYKSID